MIESERADLLADVAAPIRRVFESESRDHLAQACRTDEGAIQGFLGVSARVGGGSDGALLESSATFAIGKANI
jgi:hypothetical protein